MPTPHAHYPHTVTDEGGGLLAYEEAMGSVHT